MENEILEQKFISAKDLKKIIPQLGINQCREIIKLAKTKMENDGCIKLNTKPIIALTSYVKEILKLEG